MSRPISSSTPRSAVRQPGAGVFQPNRVAGVRGHGHHGQGAVAQHAAGTGGPAQIMRIDRRRITRSVAKLARMRRSLRRAAAGPAREATVTQQAVTGLVRERLRPAGDHYHRGRSEAPAAARSLSGRAGPVLVIIGSRPSPASPSSPAAPPARACDANPLAGFGSEASKDQHYVLDAAHNERDDKTMTGRVEGKVAFITGAARGQGRSHAVTLAREGADIIAVDIAAQIGTVPYPMATAEDLAQTVKEVQATGRRIVATQADVRDYGALKEALDDGVARLGRLDIVSANAGITSYGRAEELPEQTWRDVIDVDLTGEWHAAKAAIPHLRAGGRGGSIILTSSELGLRAAPNTVHYTAAKHGVVGGIPLSFAPGRYQPRTSGRGRVLEH
jgi:NADP-dependent 3-hydroxy acid dehydrogenase YdfG